jgi:hypothetical protein
MHLQILPAQLLVKNSIQLKASQVSVSLHVQSTIHKRQGIQIHYGSYTGPAHCVVKHYPSICHVSFLTRTQHSTEKPDRVMFGGLHIAVRFHQMPRTHLPPNVYAVTKRSRTIAFAHPMQHEQPGCSSALSLTAVPLPLHLQNCSSSYVRSFAVWLRRVLTEPCMSCALWAWRTSEKRRKRYGACCSASVNNKE